MQPHTRGRSGKQVNKGGLKTGKAGAKMNRRQIDELDEKALYAMELRLIKKHFPGLNARPIKIDNTTKNYAEAAEPAMIFNLRAHKSRRQVRETLLHELIHYELMDKGKFLGHGRDFLRRAKELGILGRSELFQCSRLEEEERTPHRVEYSQTPLTDFAQNIDREFWDLLEFVAKRTPITLRLQLYQKVKSIETLWTCYRSAVQQGADHITSEIWKKRRGPRGKPPQELLTEARNINEKIDEIQKKFFATGDKSLLKEIQKLNRKLDPIENKLQRDYALDVS